MPLQNIFLTSSDDPDRIVQPNISSIFSILLVLATCTSGSINTATSGSTDLFLAEIFNNPPCTEIN